MKKFIKLLPGDNIYRVDIDWLESSENYKLSYTVTKLDVNGPAVFNHDRTHVIVPYMENDESFHIMVPVEYKEESISYENAQHIFTTDESLVKKAISAFCDKEMKNISEQIDWCYQRIGILENDYELYENLKKSL